jgi:predicted DsbA family dithiol-disulfide isomerase
MTVAVTHFTDPGCPWAYSARPALRTLEWRFGDQLDWELVVIGLTEDAKQYEDRGYTPERMVSSWPVYHERFGMPFGYQVKAGVSATSRACRAVMLANEQSHELGEAALSALQFMQFTTIEMLEDAAAIADALNQVDGLDGAAIAARLEDADVLERYEAQRTRARQAAGGATEAQGKSADSDGPVRYTAPSLIFTAPGGSSLEAGGFQTIEAYDVILANLDPTLERRPRAESATEVLDFFARPLPTAEIAAVMAEPMMPPNTGAVLADLQELTADGKLLRDPLGDDALWRAAV